MTHADSGRFQSAPSHCLHWLTQGGTPKYVRRLPSTICRIQKYFMFDRNLFDGFFLQRVPLCFNPCQTCKPTRCVQIYASSMLLCALLEGHRRHLPSCVLRHHLCSDTMLRRPPNRSFPPGPPKLPDLTPQSSKLGRSPLPAPPAPQSSKKPEPANRAGFRCRTSRLLRVA